VKESFRAGLMGGVLLSALVPIWAATAQSQQQVDRCANNDQNVTLDQRIDACTAAIASGKWSGPGLAWAYNNRSFAYILQGDYDRGIADADEAIRLDPNDAVAFNNRGNGYREKELYDRAIADYTEAIRIDPSYALAFKNRGSVYQQQGDLDRAIADYSKAVQLEPTFAIAFADRASAYQEKGDFDHAVVDFGTLIRLSPRDAKAFYSRGVAYQLSGDLDRALADYDQAIALDPANFFAFNNRAVIYRVKGDLDRAIADYDAAIRLDPNEATFYYNRGTAEVYMGSLPAGLADFNRAAELKPRSAYVALWIDILARRSNLPSELAAHAAQLDMNRWPAPIVRLYLGLATQSEVLAAAADADGKIKTEQLCTAYFFGGELALAQGAKDEAARLFRLAVADCTKDTLPRTDAISELKTLGAVP
jgi:tetratricopeptide (TPR) repeat protein